MWWWYTACRVRVANELGAGNGKGAKFATIVSVVTSSLIGLFFWLLIMIYHKEIALIFTSSEVILQAVNELSILLAFTILLNSIQPVFSGNIYIYIYRLLIISFSTKQWYLDRKIWSIGNKKITIKQACIGIDFVYPKESIRLTYNCIGFLKGWLWDLDGSRTWHT